MRDLAPDFKTYIFGIVFQFPKIWLEKNDGYFFYLMGLQGPCGAEKVRRNLLVNFSISFCTPTLNTCETAKIIIIMTKIVFVMYGMVNGYARQVPSAEEPLGSGHMTSKYNPPSLSSPS